MSVGFVIVFKVTVGGMTLYSQCLGKITALAEEPGKHNEPQEDRQLFHT